MDVIGRKLANKILPSEGRYEIMEGSNSTTRLAQTPVTEYDLHLEMTPSTCGSFSGPTFTVSEAVDYLGFGRFQMILSIFTGICWMSDAMELMTLSILPPALHCHFCITDYQEAFLSTLVFVGMMVSAPVWGSLCDNHGRRNSLWIAFGLLFIFGGLSAFSMTFYWLLAFRFLMGIAFGCAPQSVTLYAEFLPSKDRTRWISFMSFIWAFGACVEVLLALVVMPTLGWRWFLGFSALPLLIFVVSCYWVPESVRYLAVSGQSEKALQTLERIGRKNKKTLPEGRLVVDEAGSERGRFKDLFSSDMRLSTILLWFIWIACAFSYYGVVFLSTEILEQKAGHEVTSKFVSGNETHTVVNTVMATTGSKMDENGFVDGVCDTTRSSCKVLSQADYFDMFWISVSEFPAILITLYMLDGIGRKKTMCIQFLLFAASMFAFTFKIDGRMLTTTLLFVARLLVSAVFQAVWIYTPEVYPTGIRAIGLGACASMSRIGSIVTPYISQVLSKTSIPTAAAIYGVAGVVAAILSMLLPIETKGKSLTD